MSFVYRGSVTDGGLQAASAGAKDQEAVNFLEKKMKAADPLSYSAAVQLAIGALQNVLSEDLKASDIEVGRPPPLCPLGRHTPSPPPPPPLNHPSHKRLFFVSNFV